MQYIGNTPALFATNVTSECSPGSRLRLMLYELSANPCVASYACSTLSMWRWTVSPCLTRITSGVKWLRIAVM